MLQVPALGWTTEAVSAGAAACGLSPMAHGLLPRGPVELVEHFSAQCNAELRAQMAERAAELEALEAHNRLLFAMQARLRMVELHRESWAQALALRVLPTNLPHALHDAHSLAALLLDLCGQDAKAPLLPLAVDPHAKLLSIATIYGAAELHMLTDASAGLDDTWTFLEREIDAVRTVASATTRLPDLSPSGLLLSLLLRKGS
jgi:ubiquinone biosynthesis protein COQ9